MLHLFEHQAESKNWRRRGKRAISVCVTSTGITGKLITIITVTEYGGDQRTLSLTFWKRTDANKEGLTWNWERVWLSGFKWELRHGTICNLSSFALGSPSPPSVCQSRLSSAGKGHNPLTGSRLGEERYWADFLESLQVHNKELHETRLAQYKWQAHFRGHCDESVWHLRGTKAPKPFQMLIWNSSEVGGYSDPRPWRLK